MKTKYDKYLPSSDGYDTELCPLHWISVIHLKYIQKIDATLKKHGIDTSRHQIMNALYLKPNASVSELSAFLVYKMSTTTKLVYRLKDEGFVVTTSCIEDARITRVKLTEYGIATVLKVNDLVGIKLDQAFNGMTPSQIEKILQNLKQIFQNLSH
ncbi:MarR family winged helix-turn-helix transcriptional regulator [Acinetobacter sp.]|uniref:MarR family winged helix-turn-helix transcriptional regulator n=1 Tax=Acinetobacter sp. TaxID=472 RepID=UPI0031D4CC1F